MVIKYRIIELFLNKKNLKKKLYIYLYFLKFKINETLLLYYDDTIIIIHRQNKLQRSSIIIG